MADNWVKPTSFSDPDSAWTDEAKAYDGNVDTYAINGTIDKYVEYIRASILCDKIRVYANTTAEGFPDDVDLNIDVYYSAAWHNIFSGSVADRTWVEKAIGSNQTVTKIRIKGTYLKPWLYEVEFNNISVAPTVTTQAVSDVALETATGNGNITDTGGQNATKRGVCWNTTGNPTIADDTVEEEGDFGTGAFTASMTGLSGGTKYYVKAYAITPAGTSYGTEVSFTTGIVVTTQTPTDVLTTTVTANGNITSIDGGNATVRGFKYGLTQTDTWDAHDNGDFGAGAYTKGLTGLSANTTYWIRAYATNSIGTFYGDWVQFQTAASGTIPTGAVLDICADYSGYTYQLHGAETDDGKTYESYFVLSTDLTDKQGLHFNKRLEDLFSYFEKKDSGVCKIYVKRDNEATWQYAGEVSMTGDEDIIIKHLPSDNEDTSGDVDFLAKHFLIKFVFECDFFVFECDFGFIGLVTEAIPEGAR